ncbi:MAG: TonB family protein [Muribaculaceae bacterium]|nr:TonB family protein [Muribaculaceae bacterium]
MKRNWILGTLGIVLLMTALLAIAKARSHPNNNNVEEQPVEEVITSTEPQDELLDNNNDFACNLFRAINRNRKLSDGSIVVSPISVSYLLGMLNEGADGKTRQQITDVLGLHRSVQETNEYFKKMMSMAASVDSTVALNVANSIFINSGYSIMPQYKADMQRYYNAQCEALDFTKRSSLDRINNWCKTNTGGMIPAILDELSPSTVMYLLNAVYFKASWSQKFDSKETRERPFTGQNGTTVKLPMMHLNTRAAYGTSDLCQMLCLPYGNKRYCMYVLLPKKGKTINDVIKGLSAQKLQEQQSNMSSCIVDILMPRFTTSSDTDLNDVLSAMGMPLAFGSGAQISNMVKGDHLFVDMIKQKAKIEVNEKGTEAAAVTIARELKEEVVVFEERPVKFHANRPFVYYIIEKRTGTIFFMGTYCGEGGKVVASTDHDDDEAEDDDEADVRDDAYRVDVYRSAEQMPHFPGGEAALMKYIQTHIQYPPTAAKNHVQGRVIVQFIVWEDGSVDAVKVVRSVDKDLDKEAIRVCKTLPKFTPGRQNGKIVPVWYTLPVTFQLPEK